ncbi:MAG: FMN-binding protein, partial [Eubacteriales bacterium]|nr:FMN-binding protein [Eubacteriales bacterium]
FVGKKAPLKLEDVEAVASATVTSEAVVEAVNNAFASINAEKPETEEPKTEEPAAAGVKGSGEGFGGDVDVEVVFDADGVIESVKIDEETFAETVGIGTNVLDDEDFLKSFVGKKAPLKLEDVEAVAGATVTSEAVVEAINNAFENR